MAVGLFPPEGLLPVAGVRIGTASAGINKPGRKDVAVFELATGSRCAAMFTRNRFQAAPVLVARDHLTQTDPRFWLVNSGNANAGLGDAGVRDARDSCGFVARPTGTSPAAVLPFSTGVIGEPLPMAAFERGTREALGALSDDGWLDAAKAIMTTDTLPKGASRRVDLGGSTVTLTGIAKGSGMIRPDMATMLAFVATDADVDHDALQQALDRSADGSFNRITVDGDTSTNDAVASVATARARAEPILAGTTAFDRFCSALAELCSELAQAIVRDAEGATKFVTIRVEDGASEAECLDVAYTVAHSPLVKTALYASDPNWGRILAAVGRSGIDDLDMSGVSIELSGVPIVERGARSPEYREAAAEAAMAQEEITIRIVLGRGQAKARTWTSDLSHEYVRINAEYRT